MKWEKMGGWWSLDNEKDSVVTAYSDEDKDGIWKVVWFLWGLDNEYIPKMEKGEMELRTYLKHKYLLLRGG